MVRSDEISQDAHDHAVGICPGSPSLSNAASEPIAAGWRGVGDRECAGTIATPVYCSRWAQRAVVKKGVKTSPLKILGHRMGTQWAPDGHRQSRSELDDVCCPCLNHGKTSSKLTPARNDNCAHWAPATAPDQKIINYKSVSWRARRGSNPQPLASEASTLSIELRARFGDCAQDGSSSHFTAEF